VLVQREVESKRFPASEYNDIFGEPVSTTPLNVVVASGRGRLLKLQLLQKENQVGWSPDSHPTHTGRAAQNETGYGKKSITTLKGTLRSSSEAIPYAAVQLPGGRRPLENAQSHLRIRSRVEIGKAAERPRDEY
jgi:hypothetical protein